MQTREREARTRSGASGRRGELATAGIGNMSATGWFNLSMAWLIFGIPGPLLAIGALIGG